MSELPDQPDLDQLRRQARELLRAATDGESHALIRLRAVSERVTLSVAQLAVAREYGCPSWPVLRAEVHRRRRLSESSVRPPFPGGNGRGSLDAAEERWSLGGATAITTTEGKLFPGALVVGSGHAALDAFLVPSGETLSRLAGPRRLTAPGLRFVPAILGHRPSHDQAPWFDDVTVVDDRGSTYTFRVEQMVINREPERAASPMWLRLLLDPVPGRRCGWLELRSQAGSAARLLPSGQAAVRVGHLTPATVSPAERELSDLAHSLIELQLADVGEAAEHVLRQRCSTALTRTAEIQRSGELDAASELPGQLARLCASLTEHRPADGLHSSWSSMLAAAHRTDGPSHHLDIGAALPPLDGVAAQLDSLSSGPDTWRIYLRAMPGWWNHSEDRRRTWPPVSVNAEDDIGGTYLSIFGGSISHGDCEELALRFLPRLNPLARALKLMFRGASEELAVDLGLVSRARTEVK